MREGRSGVSRGFNHVMAREFVGQLLVALDCKPSVVFVYLFIHFPTVCHQVLRIAHCDIKVLHSVLFYSFIVFYFLLDG